MRTLTGPALIAVMLAVSGCGGDRGIPLREDPHLLARAQQVIRDVGWGWFVLRWSVFIAFLWLWAKVWEAWLTRRRAARSGNESPARQGPPSP